MPVFNAINKTPGVYIQEILVAGPIPGVGTSTAAFVGPAVAGPVNMPELITNWSQFAEKFGVFDAKKKVMDPYIYAPPMMAAHAVRGFFDNGGAMCYFVRVGTAISANRTLMDRNGAGARAVLTVTARQDGTAANGTAVAVADASSVSALKVAKPGVLNMAAASTPDTVTLSPADAAKLFPGDLVHLAEGAVKEDAAIASIAGGTVKLGATLANPYTAAGTLRLADLKVGATRMRFDNVANIETGTALKLTQAAATENVVVASVEPASSTVVLASGLANAYVTDAASPDVTADSLEFSLTVGTKTYDKLSMDPRHSRYVLKVVAADDARVADVAPADPPSTTPAPDNRPAVVATTLAGGVADDLGMLTPGHYAAGIALLEKVDDVNILCVPDATDSGTQKKMIEHCEKMQDRFAVLDPPAGYTPALIKTHRDQLGSDRGYGALYYPQVLVSHPAGTGLLKVAPSGHVAGVYARTDDQKGVHKAPANEAVRGVQGVEVPITDDDHGPLNEKSVNVIRTFAGRGTRIWGARTLATETQWRYINVRRLMLFIEESIQEGTEFAVFEPNNNALWEQVKRAVTEFLERVWKSGALVGSKAEEAFRVRIDDELNPASTVALGQLIIEVKVAPTTPAEFVVFQIIQEPGRKIVSE